ncbi:hypothetical protein M758_6G096700 [Ceratodon purpureus]|nr:hypothetical protein M758_6G096700 [Ceratodon purpureus]
MCALQDGQHGRESGAGAWRAPFLSTCETAPTVPFELLCGLPDRIKGGIRNETRHPPSRFNRRPRLQAPFSLPSRPYLAHSRSSSHSKLPLGLISSQLPSLRDHHLTTQVALLRKAQASKLIDPRMIPGIRIIHGTGI